MKRRRGLQAVLGLGVVACARALHAQPATSAQPPQVPPPALPAAPAAPASAALGEIKSLGPDRIQVGRVVIDKRARSFSVPGRIHATGKPLEYLATSPGGMKAYESMLELDATGSEINLACILIGLERDPKQVPLAKFRRSTLVGQRVALHVAWNDGGKPRRVSAAEALLNPEADVKPETVEWVYTGSPVSDRGGPFAADMAGTLIGFVHDVNTVIEAVATIGVGAYGSVRGHPMLPPIGTAIELIVEAVNVAR